MNHSARCADCGYEWSEPFVCDWCPHCHGTLVIASVESKPTLAQDAEEADRMLYSGRGMPALRHAKTFDHARLESMPLFEPATKKLF